MAIPKRSDRQYLMTGPGVCKAPNSQSIQAFMRYDFSFKWGGEPATMENISDPNSQPITPTPDQLFLQNEIISPETNLKNFIYKWDNPSRHPYTKRYTKNIRNPN